MGSPRRSRKSSTEKKSPEDLQESLNKWKSKGHRFEEKELKLPRLSLLKEKYNFRARK